MLLKINSSTFIFTGILYKVKFALAILELLEVVIIQKSPQLLRRALPSK